MSTENPIIRPFDGLEELEELAGDLRLSVRTNLRDEPMLLESDELVRLASHDLRRIGVAVRHNWKQDRIASAVAAARLKPDQVDVVVTVEDSFLKERVVAAPGRVPIMALTDTLKLAAHDGRDRPEAMQNSRRGFDVEVHIILNDDIKPLTFRPHRLGTVLARSKFKIRSSRDSGGLDPKPLTTERIKDFEVTAKTVLYVDCEDVLELQELGQGLGIYVNEKLLATLSHQRGTEKDVVLGSLAVEALSQIALATHTALHDAGMTDWNGEGYPVLRLLQANLKKAGRNLDPDSIVTMLRDKPLTVAGLFSGLDRRNQRLLELVAGEDGDQQQNEETS